MLFEIKNRDGLSKENLSKKSSKKGPLFSNDDARIITSGKVYRQLFESEVQLINALHKVKYTITRNIITDKNKDNLDNSRKYNLPLINKLHDPYSDDVINSEVLILPEDLLPSKTQSELIAKMMESRKLKFNKQFEELQQYVGIINKDVHKTINGICEDTYREIERNRNDIESYFKIFFENSQNQFTWEQFKMADIKIDEYFVLQTTLIEKFDSTLIILENKRVKTVMLQMSSSSTKLERIGHLAPSSVHRIMSFILTDTNDSILRNKEIYSDLRTKLMLCAIEDNRKRQLFLKNRINLWRETISLFHFENFKNEIVNEEAKSVDTIRELLVDLDGIILKLSSEVTDVFTDIIDNFNPEQYDCNYLNDMNKRLLNVIMEFDKNCDIFLSTTYKRVEEINQKYLISMNNVKTLLFQIHIFENENECIKTVEGYCWPILGSLQKTFEKYIDSLEIIIEERCAEIKSQSRKLYNYLSSLLTLWNEHKVSLNKAEENVYQKLNVNRDSHQQLNLMAENDLNIIIDKMRQDSNEMALKESLSKCLNQLDKIKASYLQFYTQQGNLVKRYPALAEAEVKVLEEKLTIYFDINQQREDSEEQHDEQKNTDERNIKERDETFTSHFMPLNISNETLLHLKKRMKICYDKFVKQWYKTVATNTVKIVSTKIEELDSELKLRYHLHEPRYQRIEYDIHNVRAAELVIHAERVSRQCKMIDNSLDIIKHEYVKLDEVQRHKQDVFKDKMVADEISYMSVTNHSKLMNIKVMLEERNNQYMHDLRTSLRGFRQNIESKLQNLRQSNAEFVRSFKLFSVGGNFCPGEIDDFNKKIEKVNLKVEDLESEIMSNLEMVEKIHQDSLIVLKNAFEEKFKYHIIDINFMETINRSLSNVQLKIKTEVSNSNSQSQFICEKIKLLDANLRKILINKYDHNDLIDQSVLKSVLELFGCINDRSMYLDCIKTQGSPKDQIILSDGKDGNSYNMKVQFTSITVISKGGRQPNEDPGIKSVKNILKCQKEFLNKKNIESANDSNVSDVPKNELDNYFPGIQNENPNKGGRTHSPSINSELTTNRKGTSEKSKLVNKNQRLDKKYQAFSEEDSEECFTFMKKIKFYCRDILDGILYSSELYYRNKGMRKVTQPNLQDNFDQAAEDIIAKLKYYFKQAKDYHDECLQEFNKQLNELEEVLCMFPSIVYRNIFDKLIYECNEEIKSANKIQLEVSNNLANKKKFNYNDLRPDLSQASKETELKNILLVEESVYNEELNHIEHQFQSNNKIVFSSGKSFTNVVSNITEQVLLILDNLLTTVDVYNSEPKARFVDTKELVRKQVMIPSEITEKDAGQTIPTKNTWMFNDLNDILQADPTFKAVADNTINKCLITAKYTRCHIQCIKEREISISKFKSFYFEILREIETTKKRRMEETNNYKLFWDESVQKLLEMNKI